MEIAIKLAIENGWKNKEVYMCEHDGIELIQNGFLLDKDFWIALGKGLGKVNIHGGLITMCRNCEKESGPNTHASCNFCGCFAWGNFQRCDVFLWHKFTDHLIDGKDPSSFFEALINEKK